MRCAVSPAGTFASRWRRPQDALACCGRPRRDAGRGGVAAESRRGRGGTRALDASTPRRRRLEAYGRTEIGDAEAAAACRFAPLSLSAANAATLGRRGLVVIDGVLSQRQLAAARRDASGLRAGRFALAGDHGERGDAVSWVRGDDADVGDGLRHAVRMLRGVADELERHGYVASTTHRVCLGAATTRRRRSTGAPRCTPQRRRDRG